jgi:hypothetical protein
MTIPTKHRALSHGAPLLLLLSLAGCIETEDRRRYDERQQALQAEELGTGRCIPKATLIATTAGSPNGARCPHPQHRARVEATTKGAEEIGAVLFCECVLDGGAP